MRPAINNNLAILQHTKRRFISNDASGNLWADYLRWGQARVLSLDRRKVSLDIGRVLVAGSSAGTGLCWRAVRLECVQKNNPAPTETAPASGRVSCQHQAAS